MKIGLYGGSFDPVHQGHLRPVTETLEALGLDRVVYLPTARPPHKRGRRFAPAIRRYAMVELALLGHDGLYASSFELEQGRESYTVDTLEHYRRRFEGARLHYLMGSDSFAELTAWRRWRRILELARVVVLDRPEGAAGPEAPAPEIAAALAEGRIVRVANAPVEASSSEIRRRLGAGTAGLEELVPPLVLDYIAKYGLYREPTTTPIPI